MHLVIDDMENYRKNKKIESLLIKNQVFFEENLKKRFDILGYNF